MNFTQKENSKSNASFNAKFIFHGRAKLLISLYTRPSQVREPMGRFPAPQQRSCQPGALRMKTPT